MDLELDPNEIRVLGCLIEKQVTTPDQYPLSLNALTSACNQKTNRDPVLALDEGTVAATIASLLRRHLVLEKSGFGSRVPKYQHRFANTGFGSLELSPLQLAILCELFLRGPQTPGELRARVGRLLQGGVAGNVEEALRELAADARGPFVMQLVREPGRRESRYAHLLGVAPDRLAAAPDEDRVPHVTASAPASSPADETVAALAERVSRLEQEVRALRGALEALRPRT